MNFALDTNILAYAEGVNGPVKRASAETLLRALPLANTIVPVQVLGELFNVLVRKAKWHHSTAERAVLNWRTTYLRIETTETLLLIALELAARQHFFIWDAVILAAAAQARCNVLVSEDFQDGFVWQGVTVCNPFAPKPHPLIAHFVGR